MLDRESLDWYTKNRVHDPETGEVRQPVVTGEFQEKDEISNTFTLEPQLHPIINIFEDVKKHHDYIIGVDLAQGLESLATSHVLSFFARLPLSVLLPDCAGSTAGG